MSEAIKKAQNYSVKKKITKMCIKLNFISSRCKRNDIRCDYGDNECFRKPSSISYNFITLTSNISLPPQGRALFNLRGPNWYENIDFDLKVVRVDAPPHVQKVTEQYFRYTRDKF